MYIYGDFNSERARLIDIKLLKCKGHAYCADEDDIRQFFSNKFLVVVQN